MFAGVSSELSSDSWLIFKLAISLKWTRLLLFSSVKVYPSFFQLACGENMPKNVYHRHSRKTDLIRPTKVSPSSLASNT